MARERTLKVNIVGDARRLHQTFQGIEKATGSLSRGFSRVGVAIVAGIAGVGVVAGVKSTIDAASDLNETISKTNVIFGRSAKEIRDWSRGSAKSLGLSRNQALGAAASFGDMFLQLKLGRPQAVNMSKGMVQLAADMASFHNADITQVLEAQSAAFRGEYDALQRFIPNISAARVEQEALRLTHKKAAADLTVADKAQAAYNIMLKDGARASGDFARTSKGAANQQRIFRARVEDLKASIGQGLLPIFNKAILFINEKVVPAIGGFARVVREKVGSAVGALTSGIQGKFDTFKLDAKLFGENLAARIKGTAQAVIVAFQAGLKTGDWSQLGEVLGNILRNAIGNGADLMKRAFGAVDWFEVGKAVGRVAGSFGLGFVTTMWDGIIDTFKKHPVEAVLTLAMVIPIGKALGLLAKVIKGIPIAKYFAPLFQALDRLVDPFWRAGGRLIAFLGRGIGEGLSRVFPTVARGLRSRIGDLVAWISLRAEAFRNAGMRIIRLLAVGIGEQIGLVVRNIGQVIAAITRPFRGALEWLFGAGRNVLRGLWQGLLSIWDDVKRWFQGIPAWIRANKGPLSLDAALLVPAGQAIMGGFLRGLKSGGGAAMDYVKGIVGDIFGMVAGIGQGGTSGNIQKLAQRMAAGMGWTGAQWNALRNLVQNESGWNPNAQNPTSTAYGLFQFLNSTWGSVGATKTASPVGQIAAGLRYIKQRYGSPMAAWSAWLSRSPHWYAGGVDGVFRKPTLIGVGEAGPEHVTVTPTGRSRGGDVHVHFHGPVYGDARALAAKVQQLIREDLRRRGMPVTV